MPPLAPARWLTATVTHRRPGGDEIGTSVAGGRERVFQSRVNKFHSCYYDADKREEGKNQGLTGISHCGRRVEGSRPIYLSTPMKT